MSDLPQIITDIQAADHATLRERTWQARQYMVFTYIDDLGGEHDLHAVQGIVPVPTPGQTIKIHGLGPLTVDRAEINYSTRGDDIADVSVYVRPAEDR